MPSAGVDVDVDVEASAVGVGGDSPFTLWPPLVSLLVSSEAMRVEGVASATAAATTCFC